MKPGSKDIKVYLKFSKQELEILQDNTYQMAETYGLDRRINRLTGKREVGFFIWDLNTLEMVVGDLKELDKEKNTIIYTLYNKIKEAINYIRTK